VARILSPYSLKPQDFSKPPFVCEQTKLPVPKKFIDDYKTVPPLWLMTVGFPRHGKTVYLSALTLMLENIGTIWDGCAHGYLDDYTNDAVREMRTQAINGGLPKPTQEGVSRPLLVRLDDIPTAGSYCAVMFDAAGEAFVDSHRISEFLNILKQVKTLWFFVSLKDLEVDPTRTISDLFRVYSDGLQNLGVSLVGRTLIVVYTKADLWEFPPEIDSYLYSDPFRNLMVDDTYESLPRDFDIDTYVGQMETISGKLTAYTKKLRGGAPFITQALKQGITLKFCATSALGHNPDGGGNRTMVEKAPRFRVLDPFIWAVWLYGGSGPVKNYALVLDHNPNQQALFTQNLPREIWETLAEQGDVATYSVGGVNPISNRDQYPPMQPATHSVCNLVGPLLDELTPSDTRVVLVTGRPIQDLNDFKATPWRDSLMVVTILDHFDWEHVFYYRTVQDKLALIQELHTW
jgi:hypothetical protein